MPSLTDDGGPMLVRLAGDEIDEVLPDHHANGPLVVSAVLEPGAARTTCLTVSAVDVSGNEDTLPEVCVELSGCAQAPSSSAVVLAALALLVRARRRSR